MFKFEIELDMDKVDDIVRQALVESREVHETFPGEPNYQEILDAFDIIINYYSIPD